MADINIDDVELQTVKEVLDEYCKAFKQKYKDKLQRDNKIATGQLINNFDTEINAAGTTITVTLNVADYYWYVEKGRRPGKFPPIAKIRKWIDDKPIIPRPDKNGRLPSKDSLAFLIGRKIATEGIKGGHQIEQTLSDINSFYIEKLKRALQADFDIYSIKILDNIGKSLRKVF